MAIKFPSFPVAASLGLIDTAFTVNKFGANFDIDTTTDPEDIWSAGGLYQWPTTARICEVVSDSTNDTSTGTGARAVQVQGLDANWELQSETVIMNGTTAVDTVNSYIRIFRAIVTDDGSLQENDGTITITSKTDGYTLAHITAGNGQTLMALYTVPDGYSALLYTIYASFSATGGNADEYAIIEFYTRDNSGSNPVVTTKGYYYLGRNANSGVIYNYQVPPLFPSKTDLWIRADEVSADNIGITAGFDLVLIENTAITDLNRRIV